MYFPDLQVAGHQPNLSDINHRCFFTIAAGTTIFSTNVQLLAYKENIQRPMVQVIVMRNNGKRVEIRHCMYDVQFTRFMRRT